MIESGHLPLLLLVFFIITPSSSPEAPSPQAPSPPTPLFILGDSTTNCGDNTVFYPLLPPNLTSCLASRHRLLSDLIAEHMNISFLPPFHSGNFTPSMLTTGINFGSAPATIITGGDDSTSGGELFFKQSLSQQVRQVYEVLQLLNLEIGPTEGKKVANAGLFVVSFGTDDYIEYFQNGGSIAVGLKYGRRGLAKVLVSQMVKAIKDLYNANVRKIACIGVIPLGCAPRIVWQGMGKLDEKMCVGEVNDVVSDYNSKLSDNLLKLQTKLPGLQIVFCDVYQAIMRIISNPFTYGFKDVHDGCCGVGMYGGMVGCLTAELACNDSTTFVWWDLYSNTEAVNRLLANWSWAPPDPDLQICSPVSLHQLAAS